MSSASTLPRANFFEEFGSSIKQKTLNNAFATELLSVTIYACADKLTPFIIETRQADEREGKYQSRSYKEVLWLEDWIKKNSRKTGAFLF